MQINLDTRGKTGQSAHMNRNKKKDFHLRLDGDLGRKLVQQAKAEFTTAPRLAAKIISNHFHPRRP